MKNVLFLSAFAASVTMFISCGSKPGCKELDLSGKEALTEIQKYDSLPRSTYVVVPDSLLTASTREIEQVLDLFKEKGLLEYTLGDSAIQRYRIKPGIEGPDSAMFYHYGLKWNPDLDKSRIQKAEEESIFGRTVFGKEYNGEFLFTARYQRIGEVKFNQSEVPYFRQNCDSMFYKYSYMIDSVNNLAAMSGVTQAVRETRIVNVPIKK